MVCSSVSGSLSHRYGCYGTARGWCRAIHQHRNQLLTGALGIFAVVFAACNSGSISCSPIISPSMSVRHCSVCYLPAAWQRRPQPTIIFLLFNELREIVETVRVRRRRRAKWLSIPSCSGVAVSAERRARALPVVQWPDIRGSAIFAPHQVMGFIDHQQIPFGSQRCSRRCLLRRAKSSEQITAVRCRTGCKHHAELRHNAHHKQSKAQVETAQHFYQPLML